MSPYKHAEISKSRLGGEIDDYIPIHQFMDATKELCSDNRHRIFHNLWAIRQIVIPIFGHTMKNSSGKIVNVKDICEKDHILADYRNRFIPTLGDFVESINESKIFKGYKTSIEQLYKEYDQIPGVAEFLLSPLSITGEFKSLLITHNSWVLNYILPKIFPDCKMSVKEFELNPSLLYNAMDFRLWMDNGIKLPPSANIEYLKN
ncbi:MAG: hypothetical protein AAGK97_08665 [Bacteroidota bacterium]